MSKTVWKFCFDFLEGQEKWLNRMAEKGWRLTGCGRASYTFEPAEPGAYVLEATATTEEMSEPLQLPVGSPLLLMNRTTYYRINQIEKPLEFTRVYFVPEKYKFEINLYNK